MQTAFAVSWSNIVMLLQDYRLALNCVSGVLTLPMTVRINVRTAQCHYLRS